MLTLLIIVLTVTLLLAFLSSLLEGFILSITVAEIEAVKVQHPKIGARLEHQKTNIERITAAILTLNNIVNIGGSAVSGYLTGQIFGSTGIAILTVFLTLFVLFFCEIFPKTAGVIYRRKLAVILTPILEIILLILLPVTVFAQWFMKKLLPRRPLNTEEEREQEVLLLVNKGQREGIFSVTEREMIGNTLRLDDVNVAAIMTPLERVTALPGDEPLVSVIRRIGNIRFSRMPVYENAAITGLVTRDDLLHASAMDNHAALVRTLARPISRLPSTSSIADTLQHLLKNHQELSLIEGPTGQTLGVVTMEDIVRHLIGHRPVR